MPKEIEGLEAELKAGLEAIKKQVEEKTAGVTPEELQNELKSFSDKFIEELKAKEADSEVIKAMQAHIDKLDVKINKSKANGSSAKTFSAIVSEQLEEQKSALADLKNNRSASVNLEVKAVGSLMFSNDTYEGTALTNQMDLEIGRIPRVAPLFRNIVRAFPIAAGKNQVTYIDKYPKDGGAGMTGEGEKKSQVDWKYVEKSASLKKITAFVKVSKEMIDDVLFLRSEINSELRDEIEKKLDEQVGGSQVGTGNDLVGIKSVAPAFSVTGTLFDNTVERANIADVIRVAVALIANNGFDADYAVVNPLDIASLDLTKTESGQYVLPPFTSSDGSSIAGIRVIGNRRVAQGEFLVGDFTKDNLGIREEININVGYENDDFTKNMVTILAEMRAVNYIKEQHKKAFLKGTFATAITAIQKVSAGDGL